MCSLIALFVTTATPAWAITFGEVDEDNRFPNVGAIVGMESPAAGQPFTFCSGTLIHERVLLTAGHCTHTLERYLEQGLITLDDDVRVSFGQDALDPTSWLEVQEVITHPGFQVGLEPKNDPVDVGVLILKEPVCGITPANLPEAGLLDVLKSTGELRDGSAGGTRLPVVGYGRTLEYPPPVTIVPDGLRRYAASEFLALTDAWVIVSQNPALDNSGASFGDSGGPSFWTDPDTGISFVIGITSWGDGTTLSTGFRYRTDIPETLEFLDFVVEAVEANLL
jgi:secreted trypsin-like serine protease